MRGLICCLILTTLAATAAIADPVKGIIQSDTTWTGNVTVTGDVIVGTGRTLTIAAGTQVEFAGSYMIQVNGVLLAVATKQDSIRFKPTNKTTGWLGIQFADMDAASDSSRMIYCNVSFCRTQNNNLGAAINITNYPRLRISNSTIEANFMTIGSGGGLACLDGSDIVISNNKISKNYSATRGSGLYTNNSNVIIKGNLIVKNTGTGIMIDGGSVIIDRNKILKNSVYGYGGGLFISSAHVTMRYNVIAKNTSDDDGAGMFISGSVVNIINNTIANNRNTNYYAGGSAIHVYINYASTIDISNSIIYGNKGPGGGQITIEELRHSVSIRNSDIQGGLDSISGTVNGTLKYGASALEVKSSQVVHVDPLFQNPSADLFQITWMEFPSANATKSPCIDAGDKLSPHDPDGSIADMGALYFHQTGKKFPPRAIIAIDTILGFNQLPVQFTDISDKGTGNINSWQWDFGDGTTSTERNPTHLYNAGTFRTKLVIRDENGFTDTITYSKPIRVVAGILKSAGSVMNETWNGKNGNYLVNGNIYVPHGSTLNVTPDTKVIFFGPYGIKVDGQLLALGKKDSLIRFFPYDTAGFYDKSGPNYNVRGGWSGLSFVESYPSVGGPDSSKLDYCLLEHVKGRGSPVQANYLPKIRVSNSIIRNNFVYGYGGGVSSGYNCVIRNNRFFNNHAMRDGGAIYLGSDGRILNNIIVGNTAESDGSAIANTYNGLSLIYGNYIANNGGARSTIIVFYAMTKIISNTIIDNKDTDSGIFILYTNGTSRVYNNLIYGNRGSQVSVNDPYSIAEIEYNLIQGGANGMGYYKNGYGATNIDGDPKLTSLMDGFRRLMMGSPCFDAGDPNSATYGLPVNDFAGHARISGSKIDIGAFEQGDDEAPKVLSSLGSLTVNQDFGMIYIPLDSAFGYYLGSEWLEYSVQSSGTDLVDAKIDGSNLVLTSLTGKFGDVDLTVTASNRIGSSVADVLKLKILESEVISPVAGLEDASAAIALYPNPFTGTLNISGYSSSISVEVYGTQKNLVLRSEIGLPHAGLNLSELEPGVYVVIIKSQKNVVARKVVKQ